MRKELDKLTAKDKDLELSKVGLEKTIEALKKAIDELEKEVNEWLKDFPRTSLFRDRQVFYQMDANVPMIEGFCVAIWYEEKPRPKK